MMLIIYIAHLFLPFAAIAWLGLAPLPTRGLRTIQNLGVGLFLPGLWLAGAWFYPPGWVRWVHAALFIAAAWRAWRAPVLAGARGLGAWAAAAGAVGLALAGTLGLWQGVAGRLDPSQALDLAPPLAQGPSCVISGGASPLLNFHMATLAPGFSAFRGQSYGADFVSVGANGMRARSLAPQPRRLQDYHIYGAGILAPCSGIVLSTRDGLPDRPIGSPDRTHLPGNHVTLACCGREVLLAHMQPGSITVEAGAVVETGDPVGKVGNSGNSDEPHLHVHAQQPAAPGDPPQSGAPTQLTFAGRFLARGDCLR